MTIASRNDLGMPTLPARAIVAERAPGTVRITQGVRGRMADATRSSKPRRSPRYPAINLEAALDRAVALYREEGRGLAPNDAILGYWGYSPGCGPGFGTLAALKRFGLLRSEEPGKSRLSELALRIILDEQEGSGERQEAVEQAALTPTIHREIWEKYPDGLPSDAAVHRFLRRDRGFTDAAAERLIKEFRETVTFARLGADRGLSRPAAEDEAGAVTVRIPLSAGEWVAVQGRFPLSRGAWDQLMRVLDVMKPGLVASSVEPASEDV
jgi:hypothetical protein